MTKVTPLGDRLFVEPLEETQKGIIYVPDIAKEKPQLCVVRALGEREIKMVRNSDGIHVDDEQKGWGSLAVGKQVMVAKYGGTEIKVDGKLYRVVNIEDVMAILEETK